MATLSGLSSGLATNSPSGRGNAALAIGLANCKLLSWLEGVPGGAWQLAATSNQWTPESTTSSELGVRALNSNQTVSEVYNPIAKQSDNLAIYTGGYDIDISYIEDANRGIATFNLEKDLGTRAKGWWKKFQKAIVLDDGTAGKMTGLKKLYSTNDLPGYTGANRLFNAATLTGGTAKNLDVTTSAGDDKFVETLTVFLAECENPQGLLVSQALWAKMSVMLFRKKMFTEPIVNSLNVRFETFAGVPIIVLPNDVITNDEPDDTGTPLTVTTSIYALNPGEDNLALISNSGLYWRDYDHLENAEKTREKWEVRANWRVQNPMAGARLRNIKVV